jgi:hypothetical protein
MDDKNKSNLDKAANLLTSTNHQEVWQASLLQRLIINEKTTLDKYPYKIPDNLASYLIKLGVPFSERAIKHHRHPAHKTLEMHMLYQVQHYLNGPTTFLFMKTQKFLALRKMISNPCQLDNAQITTKDIVRYPDFDKSLLNRITTPNAFLHDTIHYLTPMDIYATFEACPNLNNLFATAVIPYELLSGCKSFYPKLYKLEYIKNYMIYYPEGHNAGAYAQPKSCKWLLTTNCIIGPDFQLAVTKLESNYAHHMYLITRHAAKIDKFQHFDTPELVSIQPIYRQIIKLKNPYLPKMYVKRMIFYAKRANKEDDKGLWAKSASLLKGIDLLELDVMVNNLFIETLLVLCEHTWKPTLNPTVVTNASQLFKKYTTHLIQDFTVGKFYKKLYENFSKYVEPVPLAKSVLCKPYILTKFDRVSDVYNLKARTEVGKLTRFKIIANSLVLGYPGDTEQALFQEDLAGGEFLRCQRKQAPKRSKSLLAQCFSPVTSLIKKMKPAHKCKIGAKHDESTLICNFLANDKVETPTFNEMNRILKTLKPDDSLLPRLFRYHNGTKHNISGPTRGRLLESLTLDAAGLLKKIEKMQGGKEKKEEKEKKPALGTTSKERESVPKETKIRGPKPTPPPKPRVSSPLLFDVNAHLDLVDVVANKVADVTPNWILEYISLNIDVSQTNNYNRQEELVEQITNIQPEPFYIEHWLLKFPKDLYFPDALVRLLDIAHNMVISKAETTKGAAPKVVSPILDKQIQDERSVDKNARTRFYTPPGKALKAVAKMPTKRESNAQSEPKLDKVHVHRLHREHKCDEMTTITLCDLPRCTLPEKHRIPSKTTHKCQLSQDNTRFGLPAPTANTCLLDAFAKISHESLDQVWLRLLSGLTNEAAKRISSESPQLDVGHLDILASQYGYHVTVHPLNKDKWAGYKKHFGVAHGEKKHIYWSCRDECGHWSSSPTGGFDSLNLYEVPKELPENMPAKSAEMKALEQQYNLSAVPLCFQ